MARRIRNLFLLTALLATVAASRASVGQEVDPDAVRAREILDRHWEHKMISSGDNFPTVSLHREHRGELALLLHFGIPEVTIMEVFEWKEDDLVRRLSELEEAGLVHRGDCGKDTPTFLVMTPEEVALHLRIPNRLIGQSVAMIRRHLPEIRRLYEESRGFSSAGFDRDALLILSNVLLDNWQISAVESSFLGAERPERGGKRYYYSMQEDSGEDGVEAFGIYGNQYRGYGDYTVGVYGNRRNGNPANFNNLGAAELGRVFGSYAGDVGEAKERILEQLESAAAGGAEAVSPRTWSGFEALGWTNGREVGVPLLTLSDREVLDRMALLVRSDLLLLLNRYRPEVEQAFAESPYACEVSFEEYFMWWYHLYYSAVTDRMIAEGMIPIPPAGIATYVFLPQGL